MKRAQVRTIAAAVGALAFAWAGPSVAQQPLKIGVIFPTKTLNGKVGVEGAELAAEMINAAGGVLGRKVQLIVYDTNYSPVDGVAAVQRLIDQDGVKLLTGELGSAVALAVLPITEAERVVFVASGPKHPDITRESNKFAVRLNSTTAMDALYFDKYLKAKAANRKVAIISENNDYGQLTVSGFKKLFGDHVAFADFFAMNQTDFSAIVANAKNSGAELVCIASSNVEQWGNILRVMETAGFKPAEKCLMPGLLNLGGIKVAGKAAEGLFSADIYYPGIENDLNSRFKDAFQKKNGHVPEKIEAVGFEGVWIIAQAVAKAGTDKDTAKIADIIKAGSWGTPRGTVTFDNKGQASSGELLPIVVKDGALVLAPK